MRIKIIGAAQMSPNQPSQLAASLFGSLIDKTLFVDPGGCGGEKGAGLASIFALMGGRLGAAWNRLRWLYPRRRLGRKILIWNSFDALGRNPEHPRRGDGINGPSFPPGDFVSEAVVVAVMGSAQRHRELAPIQVTAWGKITSIEKPDRGANIWSGKANDGERNFLWFYWPRNWLHVQEQDDRNPRCWMNIDPPAGALEEILRAIRRTKRAI